MGDDKGNIPFDPMVCVFLVSPEVFDLSHKPPHPSCVLHVSAGYKTVTMISRFSSRRVRVWESVPMPVSVCTLEEYDCEAVSTFPVSEEGRIRGDESFDNRPGGG